MKKIFVITMLAAVLMTGCTSKGNKQADAEPTASEAPADTLNLSPEQQAQNMQEAHDFLK